MFKKIGLLIMCIGLLATSHAKDYAGAEVYVKEAVRYGRFDAKMKLAAVSGSVSSMFLYYNDSYMSTEPWHEVDYEVLGNSPESIQTNVITSDAGEAKEMSEKHHDVEGGTTDEWHVYTMIWTPDYISWLVDEVEVRRDTGAQVIHLQDKDMNLRFNLWASTATGWTGPWDDSALPTYQRLDWVQYSEYTPGNGDDGSDFTFTWKDEFDGSDIDMGRWGLADWTFAGNRVDFVGDNVVVEDGVLILCMTLNEAGYYGYNPDQTSSLLKSNNEVGMISEEARKFNLLGQLVRD